ncbi:phage major tail protein, TP901-1 family [Bacillus spizizenii]|uniref:phage major tail protein, TP901-1 family n=1 Tax=Bacillus haynesii TaxID=1925021 RepID=UPI00227E0EB1|nr:phage major tail protein, TP901-1 family [Bacillus haynesii]MCY7797409.1 phage major tail protein, TP901-1 family [Bacillus spizizenii]MCY8439223.1 phage major tail protein, TP901-1 family [Bacillus haynesii]MCY8747288.1 phage major tail protein, TP901-1 family [Bacillus spizizenii]MCY8803686.1 phage major tail protein, TP901-1 family [Bacillus spizizenii]MCY8880700.1 phage major tail protein, TP901-1 family [Bacillus spizizenii]
MAQVAKKVAGVDVLLKIKKADGTVLILGGQTGATLNREAETMEVTDKTSGGWASSLPGIKSWSIDADGFVVLGDVALEAVEEAFNDRVPVEAEIRVGATDDLDGVTYNGTGYIVDLPLEFAQDDAVTYSLSIEGATPLVRTKGAVTESTQSA